MNLNLNMTVDTTNGAQGTAFAHQQHHPQLVQEQPHDGHPSPHVGHAQPLHYQYDRAPAPSHTPMESPLVSQTQLQPPPQPQPQPQPQYHHHQQQQPMQAYGPPTPQHTPIHLSSGSTHHGHQHQQQQQQQQQQQLMDMQTYQQHQHQQQQQHQYQHQVYAAASPVLSHPGTPHPQPRPFTPNNLPLTAPGSAANSPVPPAPVAVGTMQGAPVDLPYATSNGNGNGNGNDNGAPTGPPSMAPSPALGPGSHMGTPQQAPTTLATAANLAAPMQQVGNLSITEQLSHLHFFLATAPTNWQPHERIRRFLLPSGEHVSCVLHNNLFHITGTDIVRALLFRFQAIGRPVRNLKKFEEGIFSDLRNLKPGVDASLETNRSEFLEWLYKHNCVRTQKKQKVFYWFSVPWDQLFYDALERDLKREALGMEPTSVPVAMPPPEMPTVAGNPLLRQHFEQQHLHQQQLELQRQQQLEIQNRRVQTQAQGGSNGTTGSVGTSSPSLPGSPAVPGSRPRTPQVGPGATAAAVNGNLRQHVVLAAAAAQSPYIGPGSAVQSPMIGPGSFHGTPQQAPQVMYQPQMQQHLDHNQPAAGSPLVGPGATATLAMPPPPPPVSVVTAQDTMAFGSGGHPSMPLLAQGLAISTVSSQHAHQQPSNMASPVTPMPVSATGTPLLPQRAMSGSDLSVAQQPHHPGRILISGLMDPMSQQSTPVVGTAPMDLAPGVSSPFVSQPQVLMTPTDGGAMLATPIMTSTPDRVQSVDPQQLSPFRSSTEAPLPPQQTPLMGTTSTPQLPQQQLFSPPPPMVNGAQTSSSVSPPPVTSTGSSSVFLAGEDPFKDLHFAWDDTAVDYMLHASQHTPTTSALSAALLADSNLAIARPNGSGDHNKDPLRSVLGGGLSKKRRNSTLLKTFSRRLSLSKELIDLYQIGDNNNQASGLDLHSSVPMPQDIAMNFAARVSGLAAAAGASGADASTPEQHVNNSM